MKRICTLILAVLINFTVKAQMFTDASGQNDLFIGSSPFGWARFNTSSESASIGYNYLRNAGYNFHWGKTPYRFLYGSDVTVKAKDGIANVLKSKKINPGVAVNGNWGISTDNLRNKGNYMSLYLRGGIEYTSLNYMHNTTGNATIDTVKKVNGKLLAVLNFQFNISHKDVSLGADSIYTTYLFLGLSSGYQKISNYNDLDDVEANTYQFGSTAATAVYVNQAGKLGTYESYNSLPINFDIAYTPKMFGLSNVGFNAYFRTNLYKKNNTANLGIGLYNTKSKEPASVVGGLAWQFNDLGNTLGKTDNLIQRSSVFFYIGFTLSGTK